jgi:transposase
MLFSDHDLLQLDEEYLTSLDSHVLLAVSRKLLLDLKESRERLNQTPDNSSVPPSSKPAYLGVPFDGKPDQDSDETDVGNHSTPDSNKSKKEDQPPPPENSSETDASSSGGGKSDQKRKPGKQVGAQGYGRSQKIPPHHIDEHRPECCAACDQPLPSDAPFMGILGFYVFDIQVGSPSQPGIQLICTLHRYGESQCICGHLTKTEPGQGDVYHPPGRKLPTALSERRLVGPTLASLIICLAFRMRLSRPRIREFLNDWLNLELSKGTISNCISEAGLAAGPVENQLIEEVRQSGLLFIDETPWKEWGKVLWLWVFVTGPVVLFLVGRRTREVLMQVLGDIFSGWIMSDGLKVYRHYSKRLRCHAHLTRKALGLAESLDKEAREFGEIALFALTMAHMQVKGKLEPANLCQVMLSTFKQFCELHKDHCHEKTRQLAFEFLNDWDATWRVLDFPDLPLTNNEAERALRHWVIARLISHGTRTPEGSRTFGILASIIETCRVRGVLPWPYLASIIAIRRRGENVPPLPVSAVT